MEIIAEYIDSLEVTTSEQQENFRHEKLDEFIYNYDEQNLLHRFVHKTSGFIIEKQYQGPYSFQLPKANQKLVFEYDRLVPRDTRDPIRNPELVEIQNDTS